MAAPAGNQFWKLRSKHGVDRLFATPELMWEAAEEYFQWCQDNPFYKVEAKTVNIGDFQSEIQLAYIPVMRAFTMHGLCGYLNCNTMYFSQFDRSLDGREDKRSKDFAIVITRIREVIYNQKFSGAASGFFNANIISRDLGLADKKEIDRKVTKINFKDAE